MNFIKNILLLALFSISTTLYAQSTRQLISFNKGWEFTKKKIDPAHPTATGWQTVDLPHTWNANDVMDDTPGYYRGARWYRKTFTVASSYSSKDVSFYFEGANQETAVFINGQQAGTHIGGYTGFFVPAHDLLRFEKNNRNEILVRVDNSFNRNIPPLSADFTFYGGLYRDVFLVVTGKVHFTGNEDGSNGVFISTPGVSRDKASVHIDTHLSNSSGRPGRLKVITTLVDKDNKTVSVASSLLSLQAGENGNTAQEIPVVTHPHLWTPEDPYLYTAVTRVVDRANGNTLDEVVNTVGFRWFRFDADKGFFLNDKPCKLVGVSRHQDYQGMGNALPDSLAERDIKWIKEMGGNFLRVAHYPQDAAVLKACDSLGILASVEIPVVNEITESDSFYMNCRKMLVEMIRQNYNHPSVIVWCYMNEIFLKPPFREDKERQQVYFSHVASLAKNLDSIARKEDPSRYTMIANHGDYNRYKSTGLTAIPMLVGWNLYSGWYGGALSDFPAFLDRHHKDLPDKPLLVTEYGADADPRIRSQHPVRFDKSVEYATRFHQYYFEEMMKRPFVAAAIIWNLADFNSEGREETMPHINNKGLLTWDRHPKDIYYYYQAKLRTTPFVKIISAYWKLRTGIRDADGDACHQPLQVASNLDTVELWLNGKTAGKKPVENGLAEWQAGFVNGKNHLITRGIRKGKTYSDSVTIDFQLQSHDLRDKTHPFSRLNILLGGDRYYIDAANHAIWLPSQAYKEGGWGSIGGKPFKIRDNNRLPYGTDKNINGTMDDPIYQTQQTGIEEYRLDVPAGEYEITLHFAELEGGVTKALAYNLSDTGRKEEEKQRIFSVYINDRVVLDNFNIAQAYGISTAGKKSVTVLVKDDKGIRVSFKPVTGEAVLNALQVRKVESKE